MIEGLAENKGSVLDLFLRSHKTIIIHCRHSGSTPLKSMPAGLDTYQQDVGTHLILKPPPIVISACPPPPIAGAGIFDFDIDTPGSNPGASMSAGILFFPQSPHNPCVHPPNYFVKRRSAIPPISGAFHSDISYIGVSHEVLPGNAREFAPSSESANIK